MATNPKINLKKLLMVAAVMFLAVALTGTALNAATFDASVTSTLKLMGITAPGGPNPLDTISGIDFSGTLELDPGNQASQFTSIGGTYISYTTQGLERRQDLTGSLSFSPDLGFGILDTFTLNAQAVGIATADDLAGLGNNRANAFSGARGWLDIKNQNASFDFEVFFNLTWSMSANTALTNPDDGVDSVATTTIFSDITDGETNGQTILADTLGRSVNGDPNFTNFTVSTDFSLLLKKDAANATRILVEFSEVDAYLTTGGEALPPPQAVPVPATLWLFGSALVGMVGLRQRFKKNR